MGQTVSVRLFTACEAGLYKPRFCPPARHLTQYIGETQTVSEILDSGVSVDGQWTDGSTGLHVSDRIT